MPWICRAFDFPRGKSGAFLTGYLQGFEVSRDFNIAEGQQIENKLKKCFILAVYMI